MLRFNPTTPVQFYVKTSTYVAGKGNEITWTLITTNGNSVFYCSWQSTFGDRQTAAQAIGVSESATVRTFYNPTIYEKLQSSQVVIIKNADSTAIVNGVPNKNNPNTYQLWGGVDNVSQENQFLEFPVRRYEDK